MLVNINGKLLIPKANKTDTTTNGLMHVRVLENAIRGNIRLITSPHYRPKRTVGTKSLNGGLAVTFVDTSNYILGMVTNKYLIISNSGNVPD